MEGYFSAAGFLMSCLLVFRVLIMKCIIDWKGFQSLTTSFAEHGLMDNRLMDNFSYPQKAVIL